MKTRTAAESHRAAGRPAQRTAARAGISEFPGRQEYRPAKWARVEKSYVRQGTETRYHGRTCPRMPGELCCASSPGPEQEIRDGGSDTAGDRASHSHDVDSVRRNADAGRDRRLRGDEQVLVLPGLPVHDRYLARPVPVRHPAAQGQAPAAPDAPER